MNKIEYVEKELDLHYMKIKNSYFIKSDFYDVNKNECINLKIEIPRCNFWNVNVLNSDKKIIYNTNISQFYPDQILNVNISNNIFCIDETLKLLKREQLNCLFYKDSFNVKVFSLKDVYVELEFHSTEEILDFDVKLRKYSYMNINYLEFKTDTRNKMIAKPKERYGLFSSKVKCNPNNVNNIRYRGNYIEIKAKSDSDICCLNHVKSKSAIHSHLLFIKDNKIIGIEYTGVLSAKNFTSFEVRKIKQPQEDCDIIERIFFDVRYYVDVSELIFMDGYFGLSDNCSGVFRKVLILDDA